MSNDDGANYTRSYPIFIMWLRLLNATQMKLLTELALLASIACFMVACLAAALGDKLYVGSSLLMWLVFGFIYGRFNKR